MSCDVLIVAFGTETRDLKGVEEQRARIHRALVDGGSALSRVEAARAGGRADLERLLATTDPTVVHFTGGGDFLDPEALEEIFAPLRGTVECVVLGPFFAAPRADALLGTAEAVLGLGGERAAEAWQPFFAAFYQALGAAESYRGAFDRGLAATADLGLPASTLPRFAGRGPERARTAAPAVQSDLPLGERSYGTRGPVPEAPAGTPYYPLWFGTDRQPVDPENPSRGFGAGRAGRLHLGTCRVAVPESHEIGSLGSAWWRRWLTGRDGRLRLDRQSLALHPTEAFWAGLRQELAARDRGERMGLVFLHGFNTSFEAAALRAAQIGFDLQVPGVTAFYSWPSKAKLAGYLADEATIEASEGHIAEFLRRFARDSGAEQVHVIAHSMGNRGLLRALQRILTEVGETIDRPFGQIFLAAPDIDQDLFADLAQAYPRLARRTTLYVSSRDRAVATSLLLHDAPRVGFAPPLVVLPGIDTVEATKIDFSLLGHGYVAAARPLLTDLHRLMLHDDPPQRRMGLRAASTADGRRYWVMAG